jgi:Tfp pilus assembly protein FimT
MSQLIRTQKVRSTAYDIFADLTYARSEAIGRGHDVAVTSNNGTDWVLGWTIHDVNANATLRVQGELSKGLVFTGDVKEVTFDRNGRSNANAQFSIEPTDSGVPDNQKRCVRISPSGRPNSVTGPCP